MATYSSYSVASTAPCTASSSSSSDFEFISTPGTFSTPAEPKVRFSPTGSTSVLWNAMPALSTRLHHPSENQASSQTQIPEPLPVEPKSFRTEVTLSIRSKIRSLRTIALWPFRHIAQEFQLPVSTVFSICAQPNTPRQQRLGRPHALSQEQRNQLIAHATASQANRRKSLFTIAEELGIFVNERTLRRIFSTLGYHRRIARVKPFLTVKNKIARLAFAHLYRDWTQADWQKVVWTDECAFNVGGFSGNTWVTRLANEEYLEDCLLPKFRKLETIMVWGCIYNNEKGPLVIWDKQNWTPTINGPRYCEHIILPHLHPFWRNLRLNILDYVYLQQDNASPHRAKYTRKVLADLGMLGYFLDWPASSPDLNPIEQVWRLMKDRIYCRVPRPTTNIALHIAIQEEWDAITSEEIASLVNSMPERIQAVEQVRGGHTRY